MTTPTRPKRLFARLPGLSPRARSLWMFALLVAASSLILAGFVLLPVLQGTWWIVLAIAALLGLVACGGSDSAPPIVLTPVVSKLLGDAAEEVGTSVASAGNFAGNANADIVIGAPGAESLAGGTFYTGRAYVLLSPPPSGESNLSSVADVAIGATSTNLGGLYLGQFVASAENLAGDSHSELIVGAPNLGGNSNALGGSSGGDAYVLLGSAAPAASLDVGTAGNLERVGVYSGFVHFFDRALGIGDFDGDGKPDLLGAYSTSFQSGAVAIISGARKDGSTPPRNDVDVFGGDPTASWSGFLLNGESSTELGTGVTPLNWNGDAFADVAAGAPNDTSATATVHVILGAANSLVDSALEACAVTGSILDVGAGGDFPQDCGSSGPYVPKPTGFKITNGSSTGTGNQFGYAIAAGDVNGDGKTDLVIGSPGYIGDDGRVYLLLGDGATVSDVDLSVALPAGLDLVTIDPATSGVGGRFGHALAVVDLDGDGKDEIVIGAPDAGPGFEGHVTVIQGRADIGSSATIDLSLLTYGATVSYTGDTLTVQGTSSGEAAGSSLANAGDIDGDGREDLLIGAPNFGDSNGAAYVIRLNAQ